MYGKDKLLGGGIERLSDTYIYYAGATEPKDRDTGLRRTPLIKGATYTTTLLKRSSDICCSCT